MKRYISAILVPCLLSYFTGCTTLNITSKEEVKQELNSGAYYQELYVITKDNNRYHFGQWGYHIKNDTLYAKGFKVNIGFENPFEGKIAIEDIAYFEVREADALATMGLVLGIGFLAVLTFGLIATIAISDDIHSCSTQKRY